MYESFYGLREKPFMLSPDSDYLYLSKSHQAALSRLEYVLVSQPGISVITGDLGAGKTTIIRKLLKKKYPHLTVGLVANSYVDSFEELMKWILYSFSLDHAGKDKVAMYDTLAEFLVTQFAEQKRVILIIDEAHNLDESCLEQLRILANVNTDKNELLQILLIGESSLRTTLGLPLMKAFVQRIVVDCHVENLSLEETTEYINHRVVTAGGRQALFSNKACEHAWKASGGNPRLINAICDTALLYGFAEQKKQIDEQLIDVVTREKQRSLLPVNT
ncbi:MAG: AAA family ATPase [Gammaproteobacteria bacterium]|nr:AAA family ATPase [Gammaproteobacteria bacterium]